MSEDTYPHLTQLMAAWFNQDVDLYGDSDEAVLDRFVADSAPSIVTATAADIARLLDGPVSGLRTRFIDRTGPHDLSVGQTDEEVRHWLSTALAILRGQH